MEKNKNNLKFNSEFLSRPFSSTSAINKSINNNDKLNNSILNNSDNFNFSSSSFYNNNDNNISKISSVINSINFTKREINDFNTSSIENNNSIVQESSKKRKPFEKLKFDKNETNPNNISESVNKANEETQITNHTKTNQLLINNISNPNQTNESQMDFICNLTHLTEKQKSFIKTQSKTVDKETLEKAKKFNSQFNNSVPFWINFFSEVEEDNLHTNSSYFKVENKDKYVNNLIQMVKKDAELYDVMKNHQKVKSDAKNNLKTLLITELNPNLNNSNVSEELNKTENEVKSKILDQSQSEIQSDQKLKDKLSELLMMYDKLDEKEKKLIRKTTNFEEFKLKMLSEGKVNNSNITDKYNYSINNIEDRIRNCSPMRSASREIEMFKLIDSIDDDFSSVELGAFSNSNIKRLLEIDRQLNQINPDKYNNEINSELKKIKKDFVDGKEQRQKDFDNKYNKEVEKFKTRKDKKTIFDIKLEDNKKINYKDYLKENQNMKNKIKILNDLDKEIISINNRPVDENRKNLILKELEDYHIYNENTNEYKERLNKISGFYDEDKIKNQFEELENRELIKKELIQILEEKFVERDETLDERINEYKEDLRKPYEDLMKDAEVEFKDNKQLMERCDQLEKYILDAEDTIDDIDSKMKNIKEESELLEKLWNKADETFQPFDWGEDISDFPQPDNVYIDKDF